MANEVFEEDRKTESIDDYVHIGDIKDKFRCFVYQDQYLSQFIGKSLYWHSGKDDPSLGLDLRWRNLEKHEAHRIMIHSADA